MKRTLSIANRHAIVTFKGQPAGRLSEVGYDTHFAYNDGWTTPIACALPADERDFYQRGGLLPFFQHLAPEGWLRGLQARAGGTADQDDFGLLLHYGADCIGAVGILPVGDTPNAPVTSPDPIAEAATAPRKTLSGVQKKLLAFRDERGAFHPATQNDDPATFIAKFNREDLPTLVQNEDLSLRLARELLGEDEVTRARPATIDGLDGLALLVERFDRRGDEWLRLEDFAQILDKPRGSDFRGKYDSSYEEAASVIERYSARARIDLLRFYRLVVFNLAIGNADAHLKNFSLLERDDELRLSPAYDLINTSAYDFDREVALAIGGRKRQFDELDRTTVTKLGTDIGLPQRAVDRALDELAAGFANAQTLRFPPNLGPDDFRGRYRDLVIENTTRIFQ
jgi:serine/threonine-protein kinase HipA